MHHLITIKQLADQLQVKESWVRSMVFKKAIPFCKVGAHVRFSPEQIQIWLDSKSVNPPTQSHKEATNG